MGIPAPIDPEEIGPPENEASSATGPGGRPARLDPYRMTADAIREPPRSLGRALREVGPGLILAGSIVGTGELIATTGLGAAHGYTLLWFILLSCVIKVFIQTELGRYAITHGRTTLAAFDT